MVGLGLPRGVAQPLDGVPELGTCLPSIVKSCCDVGFLRAQNRGSANPLTGTFFGVSTFSAISNLVACSVLFSDIVGGSTDPPTLGYFGVLNLNKEGNIKCRCSAGGNTPAEQIVLFIFLKFKLLDTFTIGIKIRN
jgi:hypothetical protein